MYICICNAISERQVQEAVSQGASELSHLQARLGVATCCGHCAEVATEYLPGGRYAAEPTADTADMAVVTIARRSLRRLAA